MKKITCLLLLVSSMVFAQFPNPYCGPITFTNNVEPITLVNFAGINNTTSALVGTANGTTIVAHEDYTAITGNVTAGQSYPITLKGNTDGAFNTNLSVFIDWNHNNVFTDPGETYNIGNINGSTGVDAIQLVGSISVPGTAMGGNTRMRVVKKYNFSTTAFPDSCNTGGTGFGQAEDYTLSVTAVAACLTGFNYPTVTTTPGICDGFTPNEIAVDSWAGDYFYVAVTSGQTYSFTSSVGTDYYTLSTDDGVTAVASGVQPLTWVSNFSGNLRVHLNTNSSCGTQDAERETNVICGVACLTGVLYPSATYNVPGCNGTVYSIDPFCYAGEYSNVNVFATNAYTFSSSIATDYVTIASADGMTPLAVGLGTANYTPTTDGVVRFYLHSNNTCGTQATDRERRVSCTTSATLPGCATNPSPADGSTTVSATAAFNISWSAPTTGDPATSYDVYTGDTPTTLAFGANVTDTFINNVGPIGAYNTTVYWQVIAKNAAGDAIGCAVWSFTTEASPGYCLSAPNGQWPGGTYSSQVCDGLTDNVITTVGYAGEYSVVTVVSGETYTFRSSISTDFITIGNSDGGVALAYGLTPVTWVSDQDGEIRFYTHTDDQCGDNTNSRIRSFTCGIPSTDSPDYVSLQWPPTATIDQGGDVNVYGQVYEGGLTDVVPNIDGQAPGINAWIGISDMNTNPNTWTEWTPMTWNAGSIGNNDEYQANIGGTLAPGTYYYATRFNLNGGAYVYGGINQSNPNNGNFWDGTTFVNGILTVNPPPAPANDECAGAVMLTVDDTFCNGTNTNGTNLGATDSGLGLADCFNYGQNDVWYSFTVPSDVATVDISTDFTGGTLYDTEVALYSGVCGSLVELDCDNDGGTTTLPNGFSWNSLILDSPVDAGATYYVRVSGYSANDVGTFCLRVSRNQDLSNGDFSNNSFSFSPNPVRNILTINNGQEMTQIEVYNLVGQKIKQYDVNTTSAQIDMSNLQTGAYLLKITSNDAVKTIKVLKE
ncbi:T9SS type A sorting domain-containing protein [Flavobacterium capsici]|uniref:T9SS type A sorting domain-containing protein n=1 Tax=Flavobacterium capsici TaxID=3075618 RepID=A0AA96EV11_9FLAO|nr:MULTISPECIES: T9SS type A sorting domain-containing protein [unclassified Flavobacterium]WNM18307.1 T9SS type A sorting domain-containing protein [Flavobacterium sp. PMR2A8]WNM22358.1 T9SS type A sorting domain-containing protein [Flavobacterium sp. PMTSA4]